MSSKEYKKLLAENSPSKCDVVHFFPLSNGNAAIFTTVMPPNLIYYLLILNKNSREE